MDIVAPLSEHLIIPMYRRRWGLHAPALDEDLQRSQYYSADQLRRNQWDAIQSLVRSAATESDYYRRLFHRIGFEPGDLKTWADFEALPILRKEDVRENLDSMISDRVSRDVLFHKRTGGSTGEPVHLFWDSRARKHKSAVVRRHDGWTGFRPGMKQAALWGDTDKSQPLKYRIWHALCSRMIYLDTLKMDDAYLRDFVTRLRRHRPFLMMGHAHSLYFFVEYLNRESIDDIEVGAIISTAETLSDKERAAIENYFGPIVFDRYGCEELSLIASECEAHDGLHVNADGLYVEVLGASPGVPGRVIATDLVNRSMPFLRYEVGDLALPESRTCPCGRGLPRLERIYGRTSDILYSPEGHRVSGISILDTFVIHVSGVRQAQLVQDAIDHIYLDVVPDITFSRETEDRLRQAVAEIFGDRMRHTVRQVKEIPPTPRGKYQFSVCRIDPPT